MTNVATDADEIDEAVISTSLSSPHLIEWSEPYEVLLIRTSNDAKLGFNITNAKHPTLSEETYTLINYIKPDSVAGREPGIKVGCRVLAVNQENLIGKSLDEAYRALASPPPEKVLSLRLVRPLYLRSGANPSPPPRYAHSIAQSNRQSQNSSSTFIPIESQSRRHNSSSEEHARWRYANEAEQNRGMSNGSHRYHDPYSLQQHTPPSSQQQQQFAPGNNYWHQSSPPYDTPGGDRSNWKISSSNPSNYQEYPHTGQMNYPDYTQSSQSNYQDYSHSGQADYSEYPNAQSNYQEFPMQSSSLYQRRLSGDNDFTSKSYSNSNRVRSGNTSSAQQSSAFNDNSNNPNVVVASQSVTINSNSNINRGQIGCNQRQPPVPPTRQARGTRVTVGGGTRNNPPVVLDRQRSVSASDLQNRPSTTSTTAPVQSESTSNRTVISKIHSSTSKPAPSQRSTSASAITVSSGVSSSRGVTIKSGQRHTFHTITDTQPKHDRRSKPIQATNVTSTMANKSNEDTVDRGSSNSGVTTATNQISISMGRKVAISNNSDNQSASHGPKHTSGRVVIPSKRTVIRTGRRSDSTESRTSPKSTSEKSKNAIVNQNIKADEQSSNSTVLNPRSTTPHPAAWSDNPMSVKLESSRYDDSLGIEVQVIEDPESPGHFCTVVAKVANSSIASRSKFVSVGDRLVSVDDSLMDDIPVERAEEIVKSLGKRQWKLRLRKVTATQEVCDRNSDKDNEADEESTLSKVIDTVMEEARRLALTNPHLVVWSNDASTIDIYKIDGRLGCNIFTKKNPENPDDDYLVVQNIISGSAADQDDRLRLGDRLLAVNGENLDGKSSNEAGKLIEETPVKQPVRLTIKSPIGICRTKHGGEEQEKANELSDVRQNGLNGDAVSQDANSSRPTVLTTTSVVTTNVNQHQYGKSISNGRTTTSSNGHQPASKPSKSSRSRSNTPQLEVVIESPTTESLADEAQEHISNLTDRKNDLQRTLPSITAKGVSEDTANSTLPIIINIGDNDEKPDERMQDVEEDATIKADPIELMDISEDELARSKLVDSAFEKALENGKVKASRARCIFLGDKSSGKSALFKILSGQMSKVMRKMSLVGDGDDVTAETEVNDARSRSDSLLQIPTLEQPVDTTNDNDSDDVFTTEAIPLRPMRRPSFIGDLNSRLLPANLLAAFGGGGGAGGASTAVPNLGGSGHTPAPGNRQLSEFDRHAGKLVAFTLKRLYSETKDLSMLEPCDAWDKRIPYNAISRYLKSNSTMDISAEDFSSTARLRLDFWDISGHKLTRSVHHVHLAKFGVNLVIFNASSMMKNEEKQLQSLHYWLNSIRTYTSPTAPVILVGTHGDELSLDDIRAINKQLSKHFVQSFGGQLARSEDGSLMYLVECMHGIKDEGAARLLDKMFECAKQQEYSNEAVPLRWVMFREQLNRLQKEQNVRCVTLSSVKKLARQVCNIKSEQEQSKALEYLHHYRKIIYPKILPSVQADNVILNAFVIIDTQCVLEATTALIYQPSHCKETKLFQHKWERLSTYAVADTDLLLHAWEKFREPSEVLINVMEALHIFYRISDNCNFTTKQTKDKKSLKEFDGERPCLFSSIKSTRFIMPYLLKDQMDYSSWEVSPEDISFYWDFHGFLPAPIFIKTMIDIMSKQDENCAVTPIICQSGGIFSLYADAYIFKLEMYSEKCQIKLTARIREGFTGWNLMKELNAIVKEVRDRFFPNVFYHCGPACPLDRCLSADQAFNRIHILKVDFLNPTAPIQCGQIVVDEHPHVKEWLPGDDEQTMAENLEKLIKPESIGKHIDTLPTRVRNRVCDLLNGQTPLVKDWRWLAFELMEITTQRLVRFKLQDNPASSLLSEWSKKSQSSVQVLVKKLRNIKRDDCVNVLSKWLENS